MKTAVELLAGTLHIPLNRFEDRRGSFVKTYLDSALRSIGIAFELREEFYSISTAGVVRGMHFQCPPHDHDKIVYCAQGRALDVLLDLRSGPGYGRAASVMLSSEAPSIIFVPKGVAHGFKALADGTLMVYKTSTEYSPSHDAGVRWDSFGFDWGSGAPAMSERDLSHPILAEFKSPFGSR
jgi:dTDP-4-dehydrorhamnose 3,5-epimerase